MSHGAKSLVWLLLVVSSCIAPSDGTTPVRPGIEVLISDSLHLLDGIRVGLLTNQTGVVRDGSSDVESLIEAGVELTALFSPEHGFRGVLDEAAIGHSVDATTGLPIYSLYGDTRAPTSEMLSLIDVLVIDLQDIGARPYTYISTALLAMQAASAQQLPVVILDRPNPIGGELVQGPVMSAEHTSFVGMLRIPLRHGMTMGELAAYGNTELDIDARLTVIPADGWERAQWFDDAGLPWIRPSPSMPNLESATHYPGIVLFESTNLSVGRGTPIAFQVVAAPWLEPADVMRAIAPHSGVSVTDTMVTPIAPPDGKYANTPMPALRLRSTDRQAYNSIELASDILAAIHAVHGDSLTIRQASLQRLAGTDEIRQFVERGHSLDQLWRDWRTDVSAFEAKRAAFLLYR